MMVIIMLLDILNFGLGTFLSLLIIELPPIFVYLLINIEEAIPTHFGSNPRLPPPSGSSNGPNLYGLSPIRN